MSDKKAIYSDASEYYVEFESKQSEKDKREYAKAKERERKYNENWKRLKVNLNEVVDQFAPDGEWRKAGQKLIFDGWRYSVVTDMAAGYVRVYDKTARSYIRLDGMPSRSQIDTHFKIKRREEM